MKDIPKYDFYKTKYGSELLIDVVDLKYIKKYLPDDPLHTLTYYDITLITEGEGFFRIDDANHQVKAGDVLFSLPHRLRAWDTGRIANGYALIFEEEFLLSFFNDPYFIGNISYFRRNNRNIKLSLSATESESVRVLIQQIKQEIDGYTVKNKHILRALLYQALMYLDRIFTEQNPALQNTGHPACADRFLKMVDAGFHKNHTVRYYAEKLHLTPGYLNELVKKETGVSAKQSIQNKLLAESKKLLLYSDLTVLEISERLAFESPSYFIRFFRKQAGCTPMQFRKTEKP